MSDSGFKLVSGDLRAYKTLQILILLISESDMLGIEVGEIGDWEIARGRLSFGAQLIMRMSEI